MKTTFIPMKAQLSLLLLFYFAAMAACQSRYQDLSNDSYAPSENIQNDESSHVVVANMHQLNQLFEAYGFDRASNTGFDDSASTAVPRLYLQSFPLSWSAQAEEMVDDDMKQLFFRSLLPLLIHSNEAILQDRQRLLALDSSNGRDKQWLQALASHYRIDVDQSMSLIRQQLLERVDTVPLSLALAQAAEDSDWGTSLYSLEYNALWGREILNDQRRLSPLQPVEGANYFKALQLSSNHYMLQLNSTTRFNAFRRLRADLRSEKKTLSGLSLSTTLAAYSSRGNDYVQMIQHIIHTNQLDKLDGKVSLVGDALWIRTEV